MDCLLLREHIEVLGQQARGVDAGERVVEGPLVWRDLEREEVFAGHRIADRLGSVTPSLRCSRKQLSSFLSRARNCAGVLSVDIGDAALRLGQIGIVGLLDVAYESAVEALDAGIAGEHRRPGWW